MFRSYFPLLYYSLRFASERASVANAVQPRTCGNAQASPGVMENVRRGSRGTRDCIAPGVAVRFHTSLAVNEFPSSLRLPAAVCRCSSSSASGSLRASSALKPPAGASIVTAVLLREYLVAAIVVLMISGGTPRWNSTRHGALPSVLNALAQRMPRIAHRVQESTFTDVSLDDIALGDQLIVLPHEICPVDGNGAGRPGVDG